MKQKVYYISSAAYLAILIPLPGRFVFGLTLMLELLLLSFIGILTNSFINKLKLHEIKSPLLMIFLISFSILYRQLLILAYPEIALTLGYYIFLPAVSLLFFNSILDNSDKSISEKINENTFYTLLYCISGIFFFLFRDLAGYGTFTFFGKNHQIFEKVILNPNGVGIFSFFATIPGALILSGLLLFFQIICNNKFRIIKNAEAQK